MKKFNYINSAKKTFKIESDAINDLSKQIDKDFESLCDLIRFNNGKFIIMGVGKSGHIGQKISATLSSTGTGSIFIHPTEAAHGDMGLIEKKDIVFLISNSGETDEIINILPSLKRLASKITSLTSNKKSTIAKASDIAIALLESKGFTKKDFASSHPAGKLGKKLITQVKHLMHIGKDIPQVNINTLLSDALLEITNKSLGITLVKNHSKVVGIFTDGDLRRCLNQKKDINSTKIKDVMTKKFVVIEDEALAIDAAKVMESNKIFTLVVMKKNKNVGVISMHDLIQARIL